MSLNELRDAVHENAKDKGWHVDPRTFGDEIALAHSELSEALEDFRKGKRVNEIWYEGDKPCGVPIEIADVIIRLLDTCGKYGLDIDAAIQSKMFYNRSRSYRHGGKTL